MLWKDFTCIKTEASENITHTERENIISYWLLLIVVIFRVFSELVNVFDVIGHVLLV